MFDQEIETRPVAKQFAIDRESYLRQVEYLFAHSDFYLRKLREAGFENAASVGPLEQIHELPFTTKQELRDSQAAYPPFGDYLAADPQTLLKVYSTSGTTGDPCYIGLTRSDLDMVATNVARGYSATGFEAGQRIVSTMNAGPFIAGTIYYGFDKIGCMVIPVGTGNTARLVGAIRKLGASGIGCTPSYGLYLIDWCAEQGIDPPSLGITNMATAGEPGGGDPIIRGRLEQAFGCQVREAMGIGDISLTVWAEDESGDGMHLMARGFVHVELIDADTAEPVAWEDGAQGELVYTALQRDAMPLLRFRSRDHVTVTMRDNPSGRTGPRVRCIGRTDDMLIVRGVNVFPSAIRNVLQSYSADIGGHFLIRPKKKGVSQSPPLPLSVELAEGLQQERPGIGEELQAKIREQLLVRTEVSLVPYGTLPRSEYKTKLVDYSDA